jgi:hypothetical protein
MRIPIPSIDEQIAQLRAAGWVSLTRKCWKAPAGSGCAGCFLGPHGAWKAMIRGQERAMAKDLPQKAGGR